MNAEEARNILANSDDRDDPVTLPVGVLAKLDVNDLPDGGTFEIGTLTEGIVHLEWIGKIGRDGNTAFGEADLTWSRKYWYSPLGLEQYLDLVRRAVETRHRTRGGVELIHYDDDGAYVSLYFRINTKETNLARVYSAVRKIAAEVEENSRTGSR